MPPRVAKLQTPEARGGAGEAQLVKMRRISVARSARGSAAPRLRRAVDRIMEEPFHTARFAARAARLAVSLSAASSGAVCRRRQGRCPAPERLARFSFFFLAPGSAGTGGDENEIAVAIPGEPVGPRTRGT